MNFKTLSWPPTAQPSESNKKIQSKAIKTASLDHITKPSVLSSSPQSASCAVTKQAGMKRKKPSGLCCKKGKKREEEEGRERTRWELAADCLCNAFLSATGRAWRPQMSPRFMQTFHSDPAAIATETKPPQQLCYCWTQAKGCLVPGWSGAGGWSG